MSYSLSCVSSHFSLTLFLFPCFTDHCRTYAAARSLGHVRPGRYRNFYAGDWCKLAFFSLQDKWTLDFSKSQAQGLRAQRQLESPWVEGGFSFIRYNSVSCNLLGFDPIWSNEHIVSDLRSVRLAMISCPKNFSDND